MIKSNSRNIANPVNTISLNNFIPFRLIYRDDLRKFFAFILCGVIFVNREVEPPEFYLPPSYKTLSLHNESKSWSIYSSVQFLNQLTILNCRQIRSKAEFFDSVHRGEHAAWDVTVLRLNNLCIFGHILENNLKSENFLWTSHWKIQGLIKVSVFYA